MIHPDTELRFVSPEIGYGVFATRAIPKGTIVYAKDQLEILVNNRQFNKMDQHHRDIVEKYSYMDEKGVRIISWDHAKYVNHKCECNTMSTGYGFEIAIRDIKKDEEITDEYGMFNIPVEIPIHCGCKDCRRVLLPSDIDNYADQWDSLVLDALKLVEKVKQPLWKVLETESMQELQSYLAGQSEYRSVSSLKYQASTRRRTTTKIIQSEPDLCMA